MASPRARTLRKSPTDAERKLWSVLRRQQIGGHRFRREHPIGAYVVDFVCLAEKLVIEVDGGQHAENIQADARRTAWLELRGYHVLRFWNNDVLGNIDGVVETIRGTLRWHQGCMHRGSPPPLPSPSRGEGVCVPSPLEG